MAAPIDAALAPQPLPPPTDIASLLTVIITTSPTPSAPSTDLLSAVLASFRGHCPSLLACPVTVVFDTYDHVMPRARLKRGCVTADEARCYETYKENVRRLVMHHWGLTASSADAAKPDPASASGPATTTTTRVETGLAEYGSPFIADNAVPYTITTVTAETARATGAMAAGQTGEAAGKSRSVSFIEPAARLGFGLAVRTAVRAVRTPYVWVQQHDWTLAADIPLAAMLDVMRTSEALQPPEEEEAVSNEEPAVVAVPAQTVNGDFPQNGRMGSSDVTTKEADKDNDDYYDEDDADDGYNGDDGDDDERVAPIRYICMPSVRMLRYAVSSHVVKFSSLRALTTTLKRDFPTRSGISMAATQSPDLLGPSSSSLGSDANRDTTRECVPLTPLFFWHDKTHIASSAHYLKRVFSTRLAIGRGDFIEDHVGQRARSQMKHDLNQWYRWACWLYYPDEGRQLCLRHLQGRTWRGEDKEREIRDMHRERNQSAASAAAEAAKLAAAAVEADGRTTAGKDADSAVGWEAAPFVPDFLVRVFEDEKSDG